jgi:hypothetical protein
MDLSLIQEPPTVVEACILFGERISF